MTCSRRWWPRSRSPIRGTVKLISTARVKTDTRDTLHLARLLAANLIPTVWVPPPPVRELRALVAHRERLVRQRTQAKSRRHAFAPQPQAFCLQNTRQSGSSCRWLRWIASGCNRIVSWLSNSSLLIRQVDAELTHLSVEEPWATPMISSFAVAWSGHHHQHDHLGRHWRDYAFPLA